jgi:hypothetical protein
VVYAGTRPIGLIAAENRQGMVPHVHVAAVAVDGRQDMIPYITFYLEQVVARMSVRAWLVTNAPVDGSRSDVLVRSGWIKIQTSGKRKARYLLAVREDTDAEIKEGDR